MRTQAMLAYLGALLSLLVPAEVPLLRSEPTAHIALVVLSGYLLSRLISGQRALLVGYCLAGALLGPDPLCFSCGITVALVGSRFSKI